MSTTLHSFMDIFDSVYSEGDSNVQLKKIVIPIIQRDYAQGRKDPDVSRVRSRFLDALYNAVMIQPITLDFVYGDINEEGTMTPLDGQQRLTTLFLLHWYAAKKCKVDSAQYSILENFSYETRYSARYFCKELIDFEPTFDTDLSKEIINQPWFPLDWKKDPTISSMLTMLDAIDDKFSGVSNLWDRLKSNAITFYFLPIKDMGLTDELYIKMNSRGKPLTLFEHFKAELEKEMSAVDGEVSKRIIAKFDKEWMDLLWRYRNGQKGSAEDNTTDDEFLNYFNYVCDVICYEQGESPQNRSSDEFDLIHMYFSSNCNNALENMIALEKAFDCWCDIPRYDSPFDFIDSFMSANHEDGKIKVDSRYRDRLDIFEDCLHSYSELSGRQRLFPLNRFVLLYAINCYLQHTDEMDEMDFRRRIRIINNLLKNSEDEVADRIDRNRIPAILEETKHVMFNGEIDDTIENHYNPSQTLEEKEKIEFLKESPEKADILFKLEDNDMLHGQISIIGLDNLNFTERFESLFNCNWDKIDCALMAIGDYGQMERNKWRFQYASSRRLSAWDELFHKSSNAGFDNTSEVLIKLLSLHETFSDEKLDDIAEAFIQTCENEKVYPWRYYYIKYSEFRPGSFGKYGMATDNNDYQQYMFVVMQTRSQFSENTYDPFLFVADENHIDRDDKGLSLRYDNCFIYSQNNAFVEKQIDSEDVIDTIYISQNENGFDTENRIDKLKDYIQKHHGN